MALYWGFVVALVALNLGFSEAQSSITSTVASSNMTTTAVATSTNTPVGGGSASSVSSVAPVSTTTQIVATTTQIIATTTQTVATTTTTVVPTSSTSSPTAFYTYLIVSFKSSKCPEEEDTSLKSKFESFFKNDMFDFKNTTFNVIREPACQFNFTFTFGPNLKLYNIREVFEDKLKRINNTVGTLRLTDIVAHVNVPGVTLGDFKDLAEVCKKICCDGGPGGNITLTKNCKPPDKCSNYNLKVVVPKCWDVCSSVCSGVPMYKISLFVLLLGVFINWFPK
ncbi:integumentary mucin C.1-like [Actinia tenebrosa]|uniref:Integumentary mucin C.1-like n=1 Tax=Actinia tenebrosa TaxID=6105 RepID=A0A6P8HSZ1_ACTTE|nr:integumentary mucin C.1-like [Actinia tenebrosa]